MAHPLLIGSNIYRGSTYGRLHPLSIPRVPTVLDLSRALGWLPRAQYRTSPMAKPAALARFHTTDYLAALRRAETQQSVAQSVRDRHGLGTLSNPIFAEMYRRPATAVGGGFLAAELVADGGCVFNPGGGTHHGFPDRAAGFCYLNEPVLTILRLLEMGVDRVAYVDIDAHHGDGVEAAFVGSERVRVISVHEARRWPFTGAETETAKGAAVNLPVPRGFNDSEFQMLLHEVILPAVDGFRPQAIFLQCGADAVAEDPLSRLCLSNQSHWSAVAALQGLSSRFIVSGGGGYNPWTVGRLWTGVWGVMNGCDMPDHLPEPARTIQGQLSWTRKARPAPALLTTLADSPRHGPIHDDVRSLAGRMKTRRWS
ncbi:MAG: acetoin utilization protein AcuC [Rhodobacteraceae bacterium]|nr:acetoin utilization protein AcuC [Paracoccaceae bacterium]